MYPITYQLTIAFPSEIAHFISHEIQKLVFVLLFVEKWNEFSSEQVIVFASATTFLYNIMLHFIHNIMLHLFIILCFISLVQL